MADSYVMVNARCSPVHPAHVMVNQGRSEQHYADVYRCDCGEQALGNTDELKHRLATHALD